MNDDEVRAMIRIDGQSLTIDQIRDVIERNAPVMIDESCWQNVLASRQAVEQIVEQERVVYGITTGFGKFSDVYISKDKVKELQYHLLRSHACGVGEPFPETVSRAMLLLRANALLKGFSGVRKELIERLITYLNRRMHPVIPQQGSLGASGDLAPLSHMALTLIGEGELIYRGRKVPTQEALQQEGLKALELTEKEGLALINGTQAMTAQGAVNLIYSCRLAHYADWIASLTIEGLQGIINAFDERVHQARGYKEQMDVARRVRAYLSGSQLTSKQGEIRVQDAYTLRCIPQVHGASWQALNYALDKLHIEMNAATDNPLIFAEDVISGGNFHGQPIALAMDFLGIGMAELANISERRIERLVNPQLNDLPPFLSPHPGLQSGAMIMQYTAASLVSENKTLAHPASVDSIPSSANQEDHVSMGTIAARHAAQIIQNCARVLAIELICAMQAVEYRGVSRLASATRRLYEQGRQLVPDIKEDRIFAPDIERLADWLLHSAVYTDVLHDLELLQQS
jgi:histidine ammonia-lyase